MLEVGLRYHFYENNIIEDPLIYYETIALSAGGGKPYIQHQSIEDHNDFINHWEIIQQHNSEEVRDFTTAVLEATSIKDI